MKTFFVLIGIIILGVFLIFPHPRPTYLPLELSGVWESSHPDYAGRTLEISEITLVFATSDETIDVYFVNNVKKTIEGKQTLFTVSCYRMDNEEETVSFYYNREDGGTIRFRNQKHVTWTKEDGK